MKECPHPLPAELTEALRNVATIWIQSSARPRIREDILDAWDTLLLDWIHDKSLPLVMRTAKAPPGSIVTHDTGREIIPSDNSPASWALTLAERGATPRKAEIQQSLQADSIPFALAIKAANKPVTKYQCNLAKIWDNPNVRRWKVAHIFPVGTRLRHSIAQFPLRELHIHFLRLMSPRNMYVVPKTCAGLSEIEPVNEVFQAAVKSKLADLEACLG